MDQFVGWVHHIATQGLPTLYQGTDAGPVDLRAGHGLRLGALGASIRRSRPSPTRADPLTRALMKPPACIADIGLALLVVFALRDRPRWAAHRRAAVLLAAGDPVRQRVVGPIRVDLRAVGYRGGRRGDQGHNASPRS